MCDIIGGNGYNSDTIMDGMRTISNYDNDNPSYSCIGDYFFGHTCPSKHSLFVETPQPIWDKQNKTAIVYEGQLREVQFYPELKLSNLTDTEIILKLYLKYGVHSFNKLDGIFSFSIIDTRKSVSYLVRDHIGKIPFWYSVSNEGNLSFCSNKKGLPPQTLLLNQIKSIEPGNYIVYNYLTKSYGIFSY